MEVEPFLKYIAMTELYILKSAGITNTVVLSTKFSFNLLRIINMHGLKAYITTDLYKDMKNSIEMPYAYIKVIESEDKIYYVDILNKNGLVSKNR